MKAHIMINPLLQAAEKMAEQVAYRECTSDIEFDNLNITVDLDSSPAKIHINYKMMIIDVQYHGIADIALSCMFPMGANTAHLVFALGHLRGRWGVHSYTHTVRDNHQWIKAIHGQMTILENNIKNRDLHDLQSVCCFLGDFVFDLVVDHHQRNGN